MLKSYRVRGQRTWLPAALLLLATCLGASVQAAPQAAARKVAKPQGLGSTKPLPSSRGFALDLTPGGPDDEDRVFGRAA